MIPDSSCTIDAGGEGVRAGMEGAFVEETTPPERNPLPPPARRRAVASDANADGKVRALAAVVGDSGVPFL